MAYDGMFKAMRDELYDEVETIIIQECGENYTVDEEWNETCVDTFNKENALARIKKLFEEKIS